MSPYSCQRNNWIFLYFHVIISCKHHQETSVLENCCKILDIAVCKYLVRLTPLCLFYCSYLHVFLVSSWNVSSFWRSGFSFSLKTQQLFFAFKTNQVWAKDFEPSVKRILMVTKSSSGSMWWTSSQVYCCTSIKSFVFLCLTVIKSQLWFFLWQSLLKAEISHNMLLCSKSDEPVTHLI